MTHINLLDSDFTDVNSKTAPAYIDRSGFILQILRRILSLNRHNPRSFWG